MNNDTEKRNTGRQLTVYSYGKINLSLDVLGLTEDGYHEVEMIMQAIMLHDDVVIKWEPADAGGEEAENNIKLHTSLYYSPK